MADSDIDLKLISEKFSACIDDNNQVGIKQYIDAYTELCKLFDILGKIFSFVLSDVRSKLEILTSHTEGDLSARYTTVEMMTDYEVGNELTMGNVNGLANGSRTLLRLHRALAFIALFLKRVENAEDHEGLSRYAVEAYNETLKHHHAWVIQKAATLAMKTLGSRMHLLESLKKYDREESLSYLRQLIDNCYRVYNNVQSVYERKRLLDLP